MSKEMTSARIPSREGLARANEPSLRASGDQGPASSGPAAVADLARTPHQTDSSRQGDRESFRLSQEEQRIVALILAGYSNKDMAHHFSLSQSTIHRRIVRILVKVGLRNKIELVFFMMTGQLSAGAQP
jgi:DNA-binding NarL/FixJ family response regulator